MSAFYYGKKRGQRCKNRISKLYKDWRADGFEAYHDQVPTDDAAILEVDREFLESIGWIPPWNFWRLHYMKENSKQIIVKMKEGLYNSLIDYCAREHLSISEVVRQLISKHVPKERWNRTK